MSKPRVEVAPPVDLARLQQLPDLPAWLAQHQIIDHQGRYLPWCQLKWRLPRARARDVWQAIRFKRALQSQPLPLLAQNGQPFTWCLHPRLALRLDHINQLVRDEHIRWPINAEDDDCTEFDKEEAISSAQLEGAATTRADAEKMLAEGRQPHTEDEQMVFNNLMLLREVEKMRDERLTLALILRLHRIATTGTTGNDVQPGVLRTTDDIYVGDPEGHYRPTPASQLKQRLKALCDFANTDHTARILAGPELCIDNVIKAMTLHFMLAYEHPFRDGNGRTARALFYWFVLKHRYRWFRYISISLQLKAKPKQYGLAYQYTETDQHDLTYFFDHQAQTILQAIAQLIGNLPPPPDVDAQAREKHVDYVTTAQRTLQPEFEKQPLPRVAQREASYRASL